MGKKGQGTEGNKPRKKSKALSYFVRFLAAVMGLVIGFCLYWFTTGTDTNVPPKM